MKPFIAVALALLLLPMASAYTITQYSADYDLVGSQALVTLAFTLDSPTSQFKWVLPYDASQVTASAQAYSVENMESSKRLEISEPVSTVEITYVTNSLVDRSSSENYFLLDLSGVKAAEKTVFLKLPEDAKLKYSLDSDKPSIIPSTSDVATDGRRIIIRWAEPDFTRSNAVMVIYEMPRSFWPWLVGGFILVAALAIGAAYHFTHRKGWVEMPVARAGSHKGEKKESPEEKLRKELTRNLFEDEKLIVETLLKEEKHELWQKQLELRTKIPKVRLSRKLRSLEAKGLVEKVPYGNTNHIRLKDARSTE